MYIAVVDDRPDDRAELIAMLTRYFAAKCVCAKYCEFSSAEEFLTDFVPGKYDLAFLDIYLGGLTGMEAARQVCRDDPRCRLLFFTTSHAHAVESYAVRAAYYLTKPLAYRQLAEALDASCAALWRDGGGLAIQVRSVETSIPLRDILYADCSARRARIHLEREVAEEANPIGEVIDILLRDERFLCCNRDIAINMDQIAQVEGGDFLLKNGERAPIRHRGKSALKKTYLEYSLQTLRRKEGTL